MADNTTVIYAPDVQDNRKNKNRFWLSKKQRDIGDSVDLDNAIRTWMWSNEGYGKRGLIVVDTFFGYTHGQYPATEEGIQRMKCDLGGRKIWGTYEDEEDLHILTIGKVRDPKQDYCTPVKSHNRRQMNHPIGKGQRYRR